MIDELNSTKELETESGKVLEEASKYSAASKEYSEAIKNWTALEAARLNREKAEFEQKKISEQLKLERTKASYEHAEKMAKHRNDLIGSIVDISKTVLGVAATFGTTYLILNYEELRNLTSKGLAFIPKPRIF